ncbi:MAG: hypothetical protein ISS34_07465 [Candidatus Omnitrophica bacterium]|nr:hypothetical protein [Candidatus Omnitrophota bacterium]
MRHITIMLVCIFLLVGSGISFLFAQSANEDLARLHSIFVEKGLKKLSENPAIRNSGVIEKIEPLSISYAAELVSLLIASQQKKLTDLMGQTRDTMQQVQATKSSWFGNMKNMFMQKKDKISQAASQAKNWIPELKNTLSSKAASAYSEAINLMASGGTPNSAAEKFIASLDRLQIDSAIKNKLQTTTNQHFKYINNILKSSLGK